MFHYWNDQSLLGININAIESVGPVSVKAGGSYGFTVSCNKNDFTFDYGYRQAGGPNGEDFSAEECANFDRKRLLNLLA